MSDAKQSNDRPAPGTIGWIDLTTENAADISDFYAKVVGWSPEPVPVEDYIDFAVSPHGSDQASAGICHRKGPNSEVPAGWMIYIHVENLELSLKRCLELGGEKIGNVRDLGDYGRSCIIRDPADAHCVLIES